MLEIWVCVAFSALDVQTSISRELHHLFREAHSVFIDHRPDVYGWHEAVTRVREGRTESQLLSAPTEDIMQFIVLRAVNDKPLNTDAVLAGILAGVSQLAQASNMVAWANSQDSAHPKTCPLLQVCVLQDDGRVFAAEFKSDRSQMFRRRDCYLTANLLRTNEGNVPDDG